MSLTPSITRPDRPRSPLSPPGGDTPLEPAFLAELVAGLAAVDELWRPHAVHDADHRGSVRLVATAAYEVWLLGWTPGQGVELHDHGGSSAALQVVEGELLEVRWESPGRPSHHRLPTGAGRVVPSGTVHDVLNVKAAKATSLHAYSPPLSSMTYYDPITGEATHTEAVVPEPAAISGPTLAQALHPAGSHAPGPGLRAIRR